MSELSFEVDLDDDGQLTIIGTTKGLRTLGQALIEAATADANELDSLAEQITASTDPDGIATVRIERRERIDSRPPSTSRVGDALAMATALAFGLLLAIGIADGIRVVLHLLGLTN